MDGSPDDRIDAIAAAQKGLVTSAQLRTAGVSAGQTRQRLRRHRLTRVHRGILTTTRGPLTAVETAAAALIAAGPHAILSHLSALNLLQLLPRTVAATDSHVTVLNGEHRHKRERITVHRTTWLPRGHVTHFRDLPLTSAERTLIDCAPLLSATELECALDQALARGLTSHSGLNRTLLSSPITPGRTHLQDLLLTRRSATGTHTEALKRVMALIRESGLPAPETEVTVWGQRCDAYWPEAKVALEIAIGGDLAAGRPTRSTPARDRRRDQILQDHGIIVVPTTWRQINEEPLRLIANIVWQITTATARAASNT